MKITLGKGIKATAQFLFWKQWLQELWAFGYRSATVLDNSQESIGTLESLWFCVIINGIQIEYRYHRISSLDGRLRMKLEVLMAKSDAW